MLEELSIMLFIFLALNFLMSYAIWIGMLPSKELNGGEKTLLFIIPLVLLFIRFIFLNMAGNNFVLFLAILFNASLLIFWIIMLRTVVKELEGHEKAASIIILLLCGTFGAVLTYQTVCKNKKSFMKDKFIKYVVEIVTKFFKSFKTDKKELLKTAAIDLLFYALLTGALFGAASIMQIMSSGTSLLSIPPELLSDQQWEQQSKTIWNMIITLLVLIILLFVVINALLAIFKAQIWKIVAKTELKFKHLAKFFALNITFSIAIIAIMIAISFVTLNPSFGSVLFLILANVVILSAIHVLTIMYKTFAEKKEYFSTIIMTFKTAIKIHKFIIPYILAIAFLLLISLAALPIQLAGETASMIISSLMMLLFIAWFRFYMKKVLDDI